MTDFLSILDHLLQAYIVLCISLLFKEEMGNLQIIRFFTEANFFFWVNRDGYIVCLLISDLFSLLSFSFRKVQISHFVSFHFVSQSNISLRPA